MRKLRLYGERPPLFGIFARKGFVAEVRVSDRRVLVRSKSKSLQKALSVEIERLAYHGGFGTRSRRISETRGAVEYQVFWVAQSPSDPAFLEALLDATWFWSGKQFAGWTILPTQSKISD